MSETKTTCPYCNNTGYRPKPTSDYQEYLESKIWPLVPCDCKNKKDIDTAGSLTKAVWPPDPREAADAFMHSLNSSSLSTLPSESILQEAEQIVNGPRRDAYGPAEESFARVAAVWSSVLKQPVTAHQVALCMIGLKLCREANKPARDNRVDLAGYVALADKLAAKEGSC